MTDQSGPARFQDLFESALQAYGQKTGFALAQHPLAIELQNCQSIDDITSLLQGRVQAFSNFRESDRMMRAIRGTVSVLTPLSQAVSLTNAVGSVSRNC
jgi:hypothetical protein